VCFVRDAHVVRYLGACISVYLLARAIKSKFAATLVQVVNVEYPTEWPSFFRDIFDVMKAGSVDEQSKAVLVEVLLLILLELDANIVCRAAHRSVLDQAHAQRVKDAMRVDCIESIVDAWYSLLVSYAKSSADITNLVLDNISRYICMLCESLLFCVCVNVWMWMWMSLRVCVWCGVVSV
jgi:Exportin 1-like protein